MNFDYTEEQQMVRDSIARLYKTTTTGTRDVRLSQAMMA